MALAEYTRAISSSLAHVRRKLGAKSPKIFARVYLASHCTRPFSAMHEDLFDDLRQRPFVVRQTIVSSALGVLAGAVFGLGVGALVFVSAWLAIGLTLVQRTTSELTPDDVSGPDDTRNPEPE